MRVQDLERGGVFVVAALLRDGAFLFACKDRLSDVVDRHGIFKYAQPPKTLFALVDTDATGLDDPQLPNVRPRPKHCSKLA